MSDSDSALSTPPATDDEMPVEVAPVKATKATAPKKTKKTKKNGTILSFFEKEPPSPPRKKRAPSPPHEPVPEDNFDVAFIVMFRSRFSDTFPPKCPHLGPQDVERGVAEGIPSPLIESLLCALLGLVLNRKKPVEKGHYGRALEEAIQTQKSQWPRSWNQINPLHGGRSFNTMAPSERLDLLKTLILWSLNQSEVVSAAIKEGYKSRSTKDRGDTNIPLSVQPWGRDGDKRRYWLIEGQDDTDFRVYRESNPALKNTTWWSVAGSIEELRALATKLQDEDGSREAKALGERMLHAIPRFEATEEKRKRREYRLARKAAFTRPEPGFSLYEGRTRGKRMKYTFSDEEDEGSDARSMRRSTRNSGRESPAAPAGPTVTASGRHVRSRATGAYGEALHSGQATEGASPATGDYARSEGSQEPQRPTHGRATRGANNAIDSWPKGRKHIETYNSLDEMDDEDDATSWDGGDEEEDVPDHMDIDDDEEDSGEDVSGEEEQKSLVVQLKYSKGKFGVQPPVPTVREEDLIKEDDGAKEQFVEPVGSSIAAEQPVAAVPAPIDEPVAQAPAPPPVVNSAPTLQEQPPAVVAVAQGPSTAGDPQTLPGATSHYSAPTPPYLSQEEAKPQPQQPQYPTATSEAPLLDRPFVPTLPAPTPASNWQ